MYKKASLALVFLTACSFFQQEEQSVVSVADTDKGKKAVEETNTVPIFTSRTNHIEILIKLL